MSAEDREALDRLKRKQTLREIDVQMLIATATVVLADEQRTANLIAWHGFVSAQGDMPDHESDLAERIEEALR